VAPNDKTPEARVAPRLAPRQTDVAPQYKLQDIDNIGFCQVQARVCTLMRGAAAPRKALVTRFFAEFFLSQVISFL
jgi:hypothetical protein